MTRKPNASTQPSSELSFASAKELGGRLAARELSPVDVVSQTLRRIERLDPELNCFITVIAEQALADARTAEAEIATSGSRGPLHGVPLSLKDIFDTAGVRSTSGSKILADHVPDHDAYVVTRLREAGAILIGKTNMHEFAFGVSNDNAHYGPCRNPWDRERVPGGSSGGTGAALAAGLCTISLGTDTGGSVRIPAGACGIVGLKPTFGRVSRRGVLPLSWSLDHVGPMTRTVEDAALLLQVIAGHDDRDEWSACDAVPDFRAELDQGVRGLTIGVPNTYFFDGLDDDVASAVDAATRLIESLGARRVGIDLPYLDQLHTAVHAILESEASAYHKPWMQSRPHDYGEETRHSLEHGYFIPAPDYVNARRLQERVRDGFAQAMRQVDAIAVPTLPNTPPEIGKPLTREPGIAWNRMLTPFNLAGLPAISLPCGFDSRGMPIGLQIAGRAFDEATVLRVAHSYERATAWHAAHPPERDGR